MALNKETKLNQSKPKSLVNYNPGMRVPTSVSSMSQIELLSHFLRIDIIHNLK